MAHMRNETYRIASYGQHWPHSSGNLSVENMAGAGFYYIGPGDKVKCSFCDKSMECWNPEDNPLREHHHLSDGRCQFIKGKLPVLTSMSDENMDTTGNDSVPASYNMVALEDLDAAPMKPQNEIRRLPPANQPKYPHMSSAMTRLQTFRTWPRDHAKRPNELFDAGFYYMELADTVRCYSCRGELNRWNPGDLPWVEHARFHPECVFLQANKTPFFIEQVQGSPRVNQIKEELREFAHSRGIEDCDINQVLNRLEPYESEEELFKAISSLENDEYNRGSTAVDDALGQGQCENIAHTHSVT